MAGYPPPPNYGAYDQPTAPGYGYPPGGQPGFVPQPGYPSQPGYPPPGYPQPGYPQPGYPQQPTVCQPAGGYYPGGQPTQTIIVQEKKSDDDCLRDCAICALCTALCCFCCSD